MRAFTTQNKRTGQGRDDRRQVRAGPRWILMLLALAGSAAVMRGAGAGEENPVALPPFIVEEAAKGPPWRYAETDGYEILSRCNDKVTRRVVEAHYQLHQLLGEVLPPELRLTTSVPRSLILYDEELQPAASQEVISRMLRTAPEIAPEEMPMFGGRGGFRVPATARRYSFLPNLRLWDRDAMAVFMIVRRDDFDGDRLALTLDYVSFMVKSRVPALPPWFVYGFLTLYQHMTYGGGRLTLEPMQWVSEEHTDAVKKNPATAPPVLPLADLLGHKLTPRDPAATIDPVKAWQSGAVLFVRWGLDSGGMERRRGLWKFVERCAREGASEALFQECFGIEYADAQAQLAAYLPRAVRRSVAFKPSNAARLPPLALRDASDGQIARLKGDWERLEVPYVKVLSPELSSKYLEQARRTLKRGYDKGDRDPRLLAALGLCECDAGSDATARAYLEAASQIGPIRPRANYELARLRFAEFLAAPAGSQNHLSVTQTADVLRPLFAARAELPPLPEVYELIADAWAAADAIPTRNHLAVLDEGIRLFPRRTPLALRAAELYHRHGYREEALAFVDIAGRAADDDATRERVSVLQRQLGLKTDSTQP